MPSENAAGPSWCPPSVLQIGPVQLTGQVLGPILVPVTVSTTLNYTEQSNVTLTSWPEVTFTPEIQQWLRGNGLSQPSDATSCHDVTPSTALWDRKHETHSLNFADSANNGSGRLKPLLLFLMKRIRFLYILKQLQPVHWSCNSPNYRDPQTVKLQHTRLSREREHLKM